MENFNDYIKSEYEKAQFKKVHEWKNLEPSVLSKAIGTITQPVGWVINKIIPQSALRGAIEGCNGMSKYTINVSSFCSTNGLSNIEQLKKEPLKRCDDLANDVHNWAIGIAATEGGAAGAIGLPGLFVDIPAIMTLAFRTINKIGLCYGFENNTEEENQFALSILSSAGSNSVKEKQMALLTLRQLEVMIAKTTWKQMVRTAAEKQASKEAGVIAVKRLAKQLGVNLTKRKAAQSIPFIGAGIGASVNGWFIKEVGWAARRVYQERWLNEKYDNEADIEIVDVA